MGLLLPSRSAQNRKLGITHWVRVWILIGIVCLLTWYGKIYKPKPNISRITDFAVWILPHKDGLGALAALPNDGDDSNSVKTGFRLWLSPPDSALAIENGGIRYRGNAIAIIGGSISSALRESILTTLDSDGVLLEHWEVVNSLAEYSGEDVSLDLKLLGDNPEDYILTLIYEGYKIGFFSSKIALENAEADSLSIAVLMFDASEKETLLLKTQTVVWNGFLNYDEAIGLISFSEKNGMSVKRLHLKNWKAD